MTASARNWRDLPMRKGELPALHRIDDWGRTRWPVDPEDPGGQAFIDNTNAIRHCTWQCLLACHCGQTIAHLLGWGNEYGQEALHPGDYAADIENIAVG